MGGGVGQGPYNSWSLGTELNVLGSCPESMLLEMSLRAKRGRENERESEDERSEGERGGDERGSEDDWGSEDEEDQKQERKGCDLLGTQG